MKNDNGALNGDLGRGYDDVDIFGLDEFGDPSGLGALYGAMVGAGVGTVASIGVRSFKPAWAASSELIGLGAGLAAGGAMVAFPSTRHAGWVAMAAAVLNNGLRAAENYFKDSTPTAGLRGREIEYLSGGGLGRGLGMIQAEPLQGAAMGGPGQVALLGGPQVSPMAARYGATYMTR